MNHFFGFLPSMSSILTPHSDTPTDKSIKSGTRAAKSDAPVLLYIVYTDIWASRRSQSCKCLPLVLPTTGLDQRVSTEHRSASFFAHSKLLPRASEPLGFHRGEDQDDGGGWLLAAQFDYGIQSKAPCNRLPCWIGYHRLPQTATTDTNHQPTHDDLQHRPTPLTTRTRAHIR